MCLRDWFKTNGGKVEQICQLASVSMTFKEAVGVALHESLILLKFVKLPTTLGLKTMDSS